MAPGLETRPLLLARAIVSAFVKNVAPSMCACVGTLDSNSADSMPQLTLEALQSSASTAVMEQLTVANVLLSTETSAKRYFRSFQTHTGNLFATAYVY